SPTDFLNAPSSIGVDRCPIGGNSSANQLFSAYKCARRIRSTGAQGGEGESHPGLNPRLEPSLIVQRLLSSNGRTVAQVQRPTWPSCRTFPALCRRPSGLCP